MFNSSMRPISPFAALQQSICYWSHSGHGAGGSPADAPEAARGWIARTPESRTGEAGAAGPGPISARPSPQPSPRRSPPWCRTARLPSMRGPNVGTGMASGHRSALSTPDDGTASSTRRAPARRWRACCRGSLAARPEIVVMCLCRGGYQWPLSAKAAATADMDFCLFLTRTCHTPGQRVASVRPHNSVARATQ
jgi:hypothetical protein